MRRVCSGFTLVELVIVMAIVGIMASISVPRFIEASSTARGSKILADMNTFEAAINLYYAHNGHFPNNKEEIEEHLVGNYMATLPIAPIGNAIIKKHDGNLLRVYVNTKNYQYVLQNSGTELNTRVGRVTLGGLTIEEILSTSEGSLTLTDTD